MINVRAIANRATSGINPNISATVLLCNGTTQLPGYKRAPNYSELPGIIIQVQALGVKDVDHLNSMNISAADYSCYAPMQLTAVDRKTQNGGDMVKFTDPATGSTDTYLVTAIFEGWRGAGWCRVALTKQIDA